jgi:hypothetical protein
LIGRKVSIGEQRAHGRDNGKHLTVSGEKPLDLCCTEFIFPMRISAVKGQMDGPIGRDCDGNQNDISFLSISAFDVTAASPVLNPVDSTHEFGRAEHHPLLYNRPVKQHNNSNAPANF